MQTPLFSRFSDASAYTMLPLDAAIAHTRAPDWLNSFFQPWVLTPSLTGTSGNDTLTGTSGNDTLDGGAGADSMTGGAGNDTYVVDNSGDQTIELANGGTDVVMSSITWSLGSEVENLTLTGTASINGTGNSKSNVLTGNSGNNVLTGGAGADTMIGGAGNDIYKADHANDITTEVAGGGTDQVQTNLSWTLASELENLLLTGTSAVNGTGNSLANSLVGNTANNSLSGGDGNDTLDGGTGVDTMAGGAGNDVFVVDGSNDVLQEAAGGGTDTVQSSIDWTLAAEFENLQLLGSASLKGTGNTLANGIVGNSGNNSLSGGSGNDSLDGGAGTDTLVGGSGNDVFTVDNASDYLVELSDEGSDTVMSSVSWTLGTELEHLTLTGSAATTGTGNSMANLITGNSGANTLNGGAGVDTLVGGAGDDSYVLTDDFSDVITEQSGGGVDTVIFNYIWSSSITYTLGNEIENFTEGGYIFGGRYYGNSLNNKITLDVSSYANVYGQAGNDTCEGGGGYFYGGQGNDVVFSSGLSFIEYANEGIDTVYYTSKYSDEHSLSANVENMDLSLSYARTGLGNELNNKIVGNAENNYLYGYLGNDSLEGGDGDDVLGDVNNFESGDDTLVGGAGQDTLYGGDNNDILYGGDGNDVLGGHDNGNDTMLGESGDDQLYGGDGNDSLDGGLGNDTIGRTESYYQAGNDTLMGGVGDDVLYGGEGSDSVDGGDGNDSVLIQVDSGYQDTAAGGVGNDTLLMDASAYSSSVTWNLSQTTATNVSGLGSFSGFEVFDLVFGSGNDNITGSANGDTLFGGAGSDSLKGGDGKDVLGYSNLNLAYYQSRWASGTDEAGNDVLQGGAGDDILGGGSGADLLDGGDGNDWVGDEGTSTADTMTGGAGNDTVALDFSTLDAALNLNFAAGGTVTLLNKSVSGFESLYLVTGGGQDTITASTGNDTLAGWFGADSLNAGDGNDVLIDDDGSYGADTFTGGAGTDTLQADWSEEIDAVLWSLNPASLQTAAGNQITQIEALDVVLTRNNDSVTGGALGDILDGSYGNDSIYGNAGDDVLIGGDGYDVVSGGDGNDLIYGSSVGYDSDIFDRDTLQGGAGNDTLLGSVVGYSDLDGGAGNDVLKINVEYGSNGYAEAYVNYTLRGGDGNDTLYGLDSKTGYLSHVYIDSLGGQLLGGAGNDVFVLDHAAPINNYGNGSLKIVSDTIRDFVSGTDKLKLVADNVNGDFVIGDGDLTLEGAVSISSPGGFSTSAELVICTTNISKTIDTTKAAKVIGSATSNYSTGDTALFVVDNGGSSVVYYFESLDGDAFVESHELTLVVTLGGTASTTVNDYLFGT